MLLITVVLAIATSSNAFSVERATGCTVSVNKGLGNPTPLILKPGIKHGNEAFYWPTSGDNIVFKKNNVAVLACPGGMLSVSGTSLKQESADAKCSGNEFTILGKTAAFNEITCSRQPASTARYNGKACLMKGREIEIGFLLKTGRFLKQITVCFDDVLQNARYSEFNLTRTIGGYQIGTSRPDFMHGGFYKVGSTNVNKLYTRNTQRKTINALVGLPADSTKYIHATNDYFLARGHYAAKADFVFDPQQRMTFYYVNAAPQWQTLNAGNWNTLEGDVRDYADDKNLDLIVYTGGHGVATLPHEKTGADVPLYLYINKQAKGIPVPEVYWKVVYNPSTKAGVAFVSVNNPYETDVDKLVFCKNICGKITWLNWKETDIKGGYSYCCDVNELRRTIKTIPNFTVSSVLV